MFTHSINWSVLFHEHFALFSEKQTETRPSSSIPYSLSATYNRARTIQLFRGFTPRRVRSPSDTGCCFRGARFLLRFFPRCRPAAAGRRDISFQPRRHFIHKTSLFILAYRFTSRACIKYTQLDARIPPIRIYACMDICIYTTSEIKRVAFMQWTLLKEYTYRQCGPMHFTLSTRKRYAVISRRW